MSDIIVSENYNKAVSLHRRICANAQAAQESLYEMCKALKEMRDGKLYKELGYSEFNDYCTTVLEVTDRQVYKYITIYENLPENFVNPGSLNSIGVTKLYLLSTLSEEERTEITENNDVSKLSKRDLEEKIAELKKAHEKLLGELNETKKKADESRKKESEAWGKVSVLRTDSEMQQAKINQLESQVKEKEDTIISLEGTIEELESKPRDSYEDTTKINELTAKLHAEEERHKAELEGLRSSVQRAPADLMPAFKSYTSTAADAMKRLTSFCEQNMNSPERKVFIEKLEAIIMITNQTIEKLKGV